MRIITGIIFLFSFIIGSSSNSYVDKVPILSIANILLQEPNEQNLRETCDYYRLLPSNEAPFTDGVFSDKTLVFERNGTGEKIVIVPGTSDGRPVSQIYVLGVKNIGKVPQILGSLGYVKQSSSCYSSGRKRCEIQREYVKLYWIENEVVF